MFKSRLVATGADNTALACALPPQSVFYLDRVSSGTLELASRSRKQDSFVVIAPSGIQGEEMFLDVLFASHILKYSYERLTELDDEVALAKVPWRSEPWGRLACISAYTGLGAWDRATVKDLERSAALRQAHCITRSVGFVIGLPGETDATVEASIKLAQRVRPERLQFTRFTPLVGSLLEHYKPPGLAGFHQRGADPVGMWVARAYQACSAFDWGLESW